MEKANAYEILERMKNKKTEDDVKFDAVENIPKEIPEQEKHEYEKMSDDEELDAFMNEFVQKDPLVKEFKNRVAMSIENGENIFTFEEYCRLKKEHPDLNVIVVNATKILNSQENKYFLVKPLYSKEYFEFVETHGPHEKNLDKFFSYIVNSCVLYPNTTSEEIEKMPAGTSNTIYVTVLNISDLNTTSTIMVI